MKPLLNGKDEGIARGNKVFGAVKNADVPRGPLTLLIESDFGRQAMPVASVSEASRKYREFVEKDDLGASQVSFGKVVSGNSLVATIAYNGNVTLENEGSVLKENSEGFRGEVGLDNTLSPAEAERKWSEASNVQRGKWIKASGHSEVPETLMWQDVLDQHAVASLKIEKAMENAGECPRCGNAHTSAQPCYPHDVLDNAAGVRRGASRYGTAASKVA